MHFDLVFAQRQNTMPSFIHVQLQRYSKIHELMYWIYEHNIILLFVSLLVAPLRISHIAAASNIMIPIILRSLVP